MPGTAVVCVRLCGGVQASEVEAALRERFGPAIGDVGAVELRDEVTAGLALSVIVRPVAVEYPVVMLFAPDGEETVEQKLDRLDRLEGYVGQLERELESRGPSGTIEGQAS